MVGSLGHRIDRQAGTQQPQAGASDARRGESRLVIVAPDPGAAAVLLDGAGGTGVITVICLDAGGESQRSIFARAVSDAAGQGREVSGDPMILGSASDARRAVLEGLRAAGPTRLITTGPDEHGDDEDAVRRREVTALAAVSAAEEYQRETGLPLLVDCRTLDVTAEGVPVARPRYGVPGNWLVRGNDGLLSAYLPTAGAVLRWTETASGSWSGPERLDAPGLLPGLTVAQGPDGYVRLIGLRRVERDDGTVAVSVVCATQYQSNRPIGPWQALGNPHRAEPHRGRFVGLPVAAFDDDGTLHVFLRNDEHTVNTRHQKKDGSWSSWSHLKGVRTADEMVAMRVPGGTVEIFARLRDVPGAARWSRSGPKGEWVVDRTPPVYAYPGSLAAAPEGGALRFRYAETGELCLWPLGASGPVTLGTVDTDSRTAGVVGVDIGGWPCTVLVAADAYGRCLVGCHVDGRQDTGVWWSVTDQCCLVPPAVAPDRNGRVTIATLGPDGRFTTTRRTAATDSLDLGPWR